MYTAFDESNADPSLCLGPGEIIVVNLIVRGFPRTAVGIFQSKGEFLLGFAWFGTFIAVGFFSRVVHHFVSEVCAKSVWFIIHMPYTNGPYIPSILLHSYHTLH